MRILIFILGLFSLGCDKLIKEDRSVCPCILTFDLTNINKDINKLNLWVLDGDDVIYNDTIPAIYFGTDYSIKVKRSKLDYYVWGNINKGSVLLDNSTLASCFISLNNAKADSIYSFSNSVNTNYEYVKDTVYMQKGFITIRVNIMGTVPNDIYLNCYTANGGHYIDKTLIRNASSSLLNPLLNSDKNNYYEFRVLRQDSINDIILNLMQGNVIICNLPLDRKSVV